MRDFDVPSEDCMIVLQFQSGVSLREAAAQLGYDPSALARKVQRIASEYRLLEKIKGRWLLTDRGQRLCDWTQDSLISQRRAIESRPRIRLCSTMGLSEKLITPGFEALDSTTGHRFDWIVVSPRTSLENDLLNGLCDLVIACHAPTDPGIAHKKIAKEEWVIAVPMAWKSAAKGQSLEVWAPALKSSPYIRHQDVDPQSYLSLHFSTDELQNRLIFDHIIGVRAAVASGLGWSLLPHWFIAEDVRLKKIHSISLSPAASQNHVTLWWLRNRPEIKALAASVSQWLREACDKI